MCCAGENNDKINPACELLVTESAPRGRVPVLWDPGPGPVVVLLSELRLVSSQLAVVLSRSVGGQTEKSCRISKHTLISYHRARRPLPSRSRAWRVHHW